MGNPIRLLVTDHAETDHSSGRFLRSLQEIARNGPFQLLLPDAKGEEGPLALAPQAEAILCHKGPVSRRLIEAAPRLRFIQKHGLNYKNIDIDAARTRGAAVAMQSIVRCATVAEHAMALMLACARRIVEGHKAVVDGAYLAKGMEPSLTAQWRFQGNWAQLGGLRELFGATAGIIALGDIGLEVARRCHAFEMEVRYFQRRRLPAAMEDAFGVSYLPLEELLPASDFLILSLPQTPETESLIGAREMRMMKTGACIINVGRGALIDEAALAAALCENRLAAAGLDVYREEPLPVSSPLCALPNVVLQPHTGGGSMSYWSRDIPASLGNIERFFRGEKPRGMVVPAPKGGLGLRG